MHSVLCDPDATLRRLTAAGLQAAISHRERNPFGPVLHSRLPWLREQGLLPAGEHTEELVIVRAHIHKKTNR